MVPSAVCLVVVRTNCNKPFGTLCVYDANGAALLISLSWRPREH